MMRIVPLEEGEKLSLTNDGQLELFFIGVGSAFAGKNNQTNLLLIKGDVHVMVDFGMTGPQALRSVAGLEPTDIEVLLPTHSHADHVGGIECLALMNRYVGMRFMDKPKLKMIISEDYQRVLWEQTLKGGLEWNEKGPDDAEKLQFSDFFDVVRPQWKQWAPREIFEVEIGSLKLELFRTSHIPEQSSGWEAHFISYGLFIDDHVFFSGDTKFDQSLIDLYAPRSEIMFQDVQFFPGAVHAYLEDLRELPNDVRSRMYLVHYGDNWEDQDVLEFADWTRQRIRYVFE